VKKKREFVAHICEQPPVRLPGTAAFLTSSTAGVPLPLTHHLKHIYALHERVLLVTVLTSEEPYVSDEARVELHELPAGVTRVVLHVGFAEMPSVPEGGDTPRSRRSWTVGICQKYRIISAARP
jgi:KUP system potassium uptake protein